MNKLIDIYRLIEGTPTVVYSIAKENATLYQSMMDKDKVTIDVVTEEAIYLQENDYVLVDGIKYKINRDPEDKQFSENKHSYTISLEAPIYTLIDKFFCNKITGSTSVTLTGKLRDFLELLIWNVNYDATDNPLGVDTGWEIGLCPDTDYMNITLSGVTCRDALNSFADKFAVEYYVSDKIINFVSHIEKETGLVFTQGKGEGLYEVERKNVDDGDLVTRVYAKGGTDNVIPGEGDSDGRLVLPEGYIENFSESNRVVEAVVEFDNIHPTFEGAVGAVSGDNNREFICSTIDFDLADVAVDDEARVNILTGDLMGKSFEFKWNNALKKITLIYQEDELAAIDATTGTRPNIPSSSKYLRGGELFNFTGVKLSGTYKTNAITKLREKATDWLSYYCRKRVKFVLNVDYRYLRKNNIALHCGDLITINVPLHKISKLIRITSIEKNLYTGKLTCVVSNYLDEKWRDKIEEEVANIKSSTTTVNGGGGASNVSILETIDEREPSDSNVLSSLRTLKEITERALSKTGADSAAGLITFAKGLKSLGDIEIGNFTSGMLTGKGAQIDALGNIEAESVTIRSSLKVLELLINRLSAIESDYVFTEADTIESVEDLGDDTYRLTLRKKWDGYFTAQRENNVLFGVINTLASGSGEDYYTSWMRVLSVNTTDNVITVVLYPGSEVLRGVNYSPVKGMVIARKGSSDSPLDRSHNERQDFWSLSSTEGRIQFLQNVAKPILEEYSYALSIGKLPDLKKFAGLPVGKDDMAVYAKHIIAENFYQIDSDGNVQTQEIFRGAWSTDVAVSDQPYRRVVNDVTTPTGTVSHTLAIHTVYHKGTKWACLIDQTTAEPKWNSPAWQFLEGDGNYSIEFNSDSGWQFRIANVNLTVTARVFYGNMDITEELMSLVGTDVQWTRQSGSIPDDNAWIPATGEKKNILLLSNDDMGNNWLIARKISFTCKVFIPTGEGTYYECTNTIDINM